MWLVSMSEPKKESPIIKPRDSIVEMYPMWKITAFATTHFDHFDGGSSHLSIADILDGKTSHKSVRSNGYLRCVPSESGLGLLRHKSNQATIATKLKVPTSAAHSIIPMRSDPSPQRKL